MIALPGRIEVFTDGPQAGSFVAVLDSEAPLIVPAISILEVFKLVLREHSEARSHRARLHTMDADFRGLGDDIELIEKLA